MPVEHARANGSGRSVSVSRMPGSDEILLFLLVQSPETDLVGSPVFPGLG